jgi:type IX secretion system PorP/SprF family membrane protein
MKQFTKYWGWCFGLLVSGGVAAQQLPARSPFAPNNFIWNPAMTAVEDYWEVGVTHQQEFVGFEDAPQTTAIYGAYPMLKQNSSLGGYLVLDEIKPIRNNTLALTYAYKLNFEQRRRRRKGPRQTAQLSLGLMVAMQQVFVDGADYLVRDAGDPLEPVGELNVFVPNVGVGIFFASRPTGPNDQSFFYAGAGTNQLLPQDVTFRDSGPTGNLQRALHTNATIGYRSAGAKLTVEPSLWLNTAGKNIASSQFNLHVEKPNAFWSGLSYSLNQTLAIQVGYVLPGGFTKADTLRLGILGSFNMGGFGAARGLGYGFYLAYRTGA